MKTIKTNAPAGDQCKPDCPVMVDIWRHCVGEPGMIQRERWRTVGEVYDDMKKYLRQHAPDDFLALERFVISSGTSRNATWPKDAAVAPVCLEGSNEGHLILLMAFKEGKAYTLFSGKTLYENQQGRDIVHRLARAMFDAFVRFDSK